VSTCSRSVFLTLGLQLAHNEFADFLIISATKSKTRAFINAYE